MKNCLIIIDMQNDFISGSLGTKEAISIIPNVKKRIEQAIIENEDIFFTKDTHEENYLSTKEGINLPIKHCIINTEGHNICKELFEYLKKAKKILNKNTFACKDIISYIDDYDQITLIGICTDICVISNAMLIKAFFPEKEIIIEENCCAGTSIENHNNAIKAMDICQFKIKKI